MTSTRSVALFASVLLWAPSALGASEGQRHYHSGKLTKYKMGPPPLLLSAADEARLSQGHAVMQSLVSDDGTRRLISVQDIEVPADVVMGRILDFEKYDKMVTAVDACNNYANVELRDGSKLIKSKYTIHAAHLKFTYFVEHRYDPVERCMVFNLDYSKQSDLDDTVGYWYARPRSPTSCRIFYSTECKLRGWVPAPVYNILAKQALAQATTWVSREANKEWDLAQNGDPRQRFVQFVDRVRTTRPKVAAQVISRGSRAAEAAGRAVHTLSTPKSSPKRGALL